MTFTIPPAPVAWNPPKPERLFYTRGDLTLSRDAVRHLVRGVDPDLEVRTDGGIHHGPGREPGDSRELVHRARFHAPSPFAECQGALDHLRRRPGPWLVGLGIAATLMLALFYVSDWLS